MNNNRENHAAIVALFGKRVRVTLDHGGFPHPDRPAVIDEGIFLGFGDEGEFKIQTDDGFVHYCWPLLDIELVEAEIKPIRNVELVEWAID